MHSRSESIAKLAAALVKVQGELKNPNMDSVNPFLKNKYTTLLTLRNTVAAPLASAGIAIVQEVRADESGRAVGLTTLLHESGEFITTEMVVKPNKDDCQGWGSAATYARRYGLFAALSLVGDEDDDGNHGSKEPRKPVSVEAGKRDTEPPPPKPDTLTPAQITKLSAAISAYAKREGKDVLEVRATVKERYGVQSTKEMTSAQMDKALAIMGEK